MKILDVKQGSEEWVAARLGVATASQFSRIVTPGGKLSSGSDGYMCELLAERWLRYPVNDAGSAFMERGSSLEQSAVAFYELQRETDTQAVGFVLRDDGLAGCSPDRFVGEQGGLEIKCPSAAVHVGYLLDMPSKFSAQVQGSMWLTGREWWDLLSYHPEMPPALVRVARDEDYIGSLSVAVDGFLRRMEEAWQKLKSRA